MKYRAVFIEPSKADKQDERQVQIYSNAYSEIVSWTDTMLKQTADKDAFVEHYETNERKIATKVIVKARKESACDSSK